MTFDSRSDNLPSSKRLQPAAGGNSCLYSGKVGAMSQGVNVLALVKGGERFVFLYDDQSADELMQTLGKYAADPEMNFSWYDCAVLCQRVRQQLRDQTPNHSQNRLNGLPSM